MKDMNVRQILELLESAVAPVSLSDELCAKYKMYDNSGIIVDTGEEVTGCLFSLDFSVRAAEEAVKQGYNLIITHHPAIYGGINRLDTIGDGKAKALALCIKMGVSVISMHLNFDAAPEGIDYYLMRGLGGKQCNTMLTVEGGAYGRVYDIEPVRIAELLTRISSVFRTRRAVAYGDENATVRRVASFCGAGCDGQAMLFARAQGADCFVSSDLKHHEIAELEESGMAVIELTHYSAEAYGFSRIYENVKRQLRVPSSFFYDERLA